MKEPICEFKSQEELNRTLRYWQHVLHLDHWCIKARMTDKKLLDDASNELCGLTQLVAENCEALIDISSNVDETSFMKRCDEHTLVHELLHCVSLLAQNTEPTIEELFYNTMEHRKIEMMAKSLIMARYDVDLAWFMK